MTKPRRASVTTKMFDAPGANQEQSALSGWQTESKAIVDNQTLKMLFFSEDWVYILVDAIASRLAHLPLNICIKNTVNGKDVYTPAPNHPWQHVLDRPNPMQDKVAFIYNALVEFILGGNNLIWKASVAQMLINLPFELVQYDFKNNGLPKRLFYFAYGYEEAGILANRTQSFPIEEIVHIRKPNPSSLYWGLSPFVPGRRSVLFNRYSQDFLNAFYLKGATPQLALTMDTDAKEDKAVRLLRSFEQAYTGRKNMRRTLLLPKGVDLKTLDTKIADQQLIELINQNRETIINLLHVPKHILGIADSGSLGSEEAKTAIRDFWVDVLMPTGNMWASSLTHGLMNELGKGFHVRFDYGSVEAIQDNENEKLDVAIKATNVMTLNEVRKKYFDLPPLDGGDALPGKATPAPQPFGSTLSLPQGLKTEGAPESAPAVIKPPEAELGADWKPVHIEDPMKKFAHLPAHIQAHVKSAKETPIDIQAEEVPGKREFAKKQLTAQRDALLDAVKKNLKSKAGHPDKELNKKLDAAVRKTQKDYQEQYAKTFAPNAKQGQKSQLNIILRKEDRDTIEAAMAKNEQGLNASLAQRGLDSFESISSTSTDKALKIIQAGLENNDPVGKISEDLQNKFDELLDYRADAIARTETLTAVSIGQHMVVQETAKILPGLKKMWVSAGDDDVRDDHVQADGQVVNADEMFSVGGEKMDGPRLGSVAGNNINCFIGSTEFSATEIVAGYRRHFEGDFVTIKTRSGRNITGTFNHPVLTDSGWRTLGEIKKIDKLVCAKIHVHGAEELNVKDVVATAEQIHGSLLKLGVSQRERCSRPDFHGDFTDSDIDIVLHERGLHLWNKTPVSKSDGKFMFKFSDVLKGIVTGASSSSQLISGSLHASNSVVRPGDLSDSLVGAETLPLNGFGFTLSSQLDTIGYKDSSDRSSTDGEVFGDFLLAPEFHSVELDDVVDVQINFSSQFVYNLQTKDGYYLANDFVVGNCRCVVVMIPSNEEE